MCENQSMISGKSRKKVFILQIHTFLPQILLQLSLSLALHYFLFLIDGNMLVIEEKLTLRRNAVFIVGNMANLVLKSVMGTLCLSHLGLANSLGPGHILAFVVVLIQIRKNTSDTPKRLF